MSLAVADARANQEAINEKLGKQYGAIFAAHAMLMEDPTLVGEIEQLITQKCFGAEYAVSRTMRRHAKALASLNQPIFSQRSSDLIDIEKSVLSHWSATTAIRCKGCKSRPSSCPRPDAERDRQSRSQYVYAFATEAGGKASHTAIMAGVLEIPAVVGLGRFLMDVSGGDEIIVDGNRGRRHPQPRRGNPRTLSRSPAPVRHLRQTPRRAPRPPAQTTDGTCAALLGNIEFPQESNHCNDRGSDGVGLYRTEFLYLNKTEDPNESEQYEAYMAVLRSIGPKKPVVIRTLDLGADKLFHRADLTLDEKNPCLGMRSVRLCLRNLPLFKTQLRAILRASHHGDVRIMFRWSARSWSSASAR